VRFKTGWFSSYLISSPMETSFLRKSYTLVELQGPGIGSSGERRKDRATVKTSDPGLDKTE